MAMFYFTILIFYTLQITILKVASFQLSLVPYGSELSDLLFDRKSSRAFCFPSEQMMASMSDESKHHNWGFSSSWNYSSALQRVGQVFCRQLGFSIYERIVPKAMEEKREKILWASECLGYEPSITHCFHEEILDHEINCTNFVGLKCSNCEDMFYTISSNETVELTSPGFPNIYNDHSVCQWTVKKDVPSAFAVNIKYLSLPPRSSKGLCNKGSLDIMSRRDELSDKTVHANLCGNENKLVLVNNSILDLKLHSGLFHPRPYGPAGFKLVISILQDLQEKGTERIPRSLSPLEIVGITLGLLILIVPISLCLRLLTRRRQRKMRQRALASAIHRKVKPTNSSMIPSIKNTPLPAVPKTLSSKIFKTENQERKSSISSGIYEDILNRKSGSYLRLEDINNDEESKSSFNYDFKVPTFLFTNYSDDAKSCPSDMPSCSFTSDFDSVFGSENEGMESIPEPVKRSTNSTYTITKPKKSSGSVKVFTAYKNKRLADLQISGQRCFSESDLKKEENISEKHFNSLQKTYTQRFSLTKP